MDFQWLWWDPIKEESGNNRHLANWEQCLRKDEKHLLKIEKKEQQEEDNYDEIE